MSWNLWKQYFERNARRARQDVFTTPALTPEQHRALLYTLQKFQLGEAGEGRLANEIDRATLRYVDDDFRACVKSFVREEGVHGRVLARMVQAMGGRVLQRDWSARAFTSARRLLGVRFKLLVALAAEVVGSGVYGLFASILPDAGFRDAFASLCADERAHLEFQSEFFRSQARGVIAKALLSSLWWVLGSAAAAVVLVDHAATFRAFGVSRVAMAWRFFHLIRDVSSRITRPSDQPMICAALATLTV